MDAWSLLAEIRSAYEQILGKHLIGIYVHGSLAMDCYRPQVSDIDFIVVVDQRPGLDVKKALMEVLLRLEPQGPAKGLEMSVVLRSALNPFVYPTPFELHYSQSHTARARQNLMEYCETMHGTDPDLAAHFTVIRHRGKVLCGQPIEAVFGVVPAECYLASLRYDVENALHDIHDHPVYIILNLCRIAAYLREKAILSKKEGGEWGTEHLLQADVPLIQRALSSYSHDMPYQADEAEEQAFAARMLRFIFEEE